MQRPSPTLIDGVYASKLPEYKIWSFMIERCTVPSCASYKNYGGRGITVCERWMGDRGFLNFLDDMGRRPHPKLSLDRKDNDKGYSPDNCRWINRRIQQINKRMQSNNKSGYRGVSFYKRDGTHEASIKSADSYIFLGRYDNPEEAALAYDCASIQINGNEAKLNLLEV